MLVTKDKYELPIIVADSVAELSKKCGVTPNAIIAALCRERKKGIKTKYKKVKIE